MSRNMGPQKSASFPNGSQLVLVLTALLSASIYQSSHGLAVVRNNIYVIKQSSGYGDSVIKQRRRPGGSVSIVHGVGSKSVVRRSRASSFRATSTLLRSSREDENSLYSFGAEVVPEGQRPVNEYLDMKQAPLFGWGSNDVGLNGLLIRLAAVYSVVFVTVGFPIAGATYTSDGYLLQKIASANVGTLGLVLLVLIRIYSGWGYVGSRLQSKVVEYEETGWYDGNFEPKTEAELKRDKFLYNGDVRPAVDRLKVTTLAAASLWVLSCVGFSAANNMKPKFDAYDPKVLNKVVLDSDYANAAAAASNDGRPTYCDSRYYRAIANGGQGCGN